MSIHPDRTAEQVVLDLPAQRLDKLLGSVKLERDHVDDDVCVKSGNPRAEFSCCLFGLAVHHNLVDILPGGMGPVGCCRTPADIKDLVSTLDKRRNQVCPDVSTPAKDDDPSHCFPLPSRSPFYDLLRFKRCDCD